MSEITLTAKEIKQVAEFCGYGFKDIDFSDIEDDCITIIKCPESGVFDEDSGQVDYYEYVVYLTEYPEEGVMPIGDKL